MATGEDKEKQALKADWHDDKPKKDAQYQVKRKNYWVLLKLIYIY